MPVPHFGVVLTWDDWHALAERLTGLKTQFVIEPGIRFKGQVGEQATFFLLDPGKLDRSRMRLARRMTGLRKNTCTSAYALAASSVPSNGKPSSKGQPSAVIHAPKPDTHCIKSPCGITKGGITCGPGKNKAPS